MWAIKLFNIVKDNVSPDPQESVYGWYGLSKVQLFLLRIGTRIETLMNEQAILHRPKMLQSGLATVKIGS